MIQIPVFMFALVIASPVLAAVQQPQQSGNIQFDCTAFKPEGESVYRVIKPTVVVWAGQSYGLQIGQTFNMNELKVDPQLLNMIREHCKQ
jgi:hypothetical protein